MANTMVASLRLNLKDELSTGLERLKGILDGLRDLGRSLSLGKLGDDGAVTNLRRIGDAARGLATNIKHIVTSSEAAGSALSRMKAAASGLSSHLGAIGTVVSGATIYEPISAYAGFENTLRHIAITKGLSGGAAQAEIVRLNKLISGEAMGTGQTSESVAAAYYGLQTGGAGTASQVEEALRAHSRAATAYNIDSEVFTPVTLALMKNFKVFGDDLNRSLAAVGQASKEGQLKVADFAETLPQIAGQMNTHGMTGRLNANLAIAALQSIRSDVGEAGQSATDFNYMLDTMYTKPGMLGFALTGRNNFAEQRAKGLMMKATGYGGIDVSKLIDDGAARGMTPIDAVLAKLLQIKSKLNTHEFGDLLGAMFTNDSGMKAWQALINHFDEFRRLRSKLDGQDASINDRDFNTAFEGPEVKLRLAGEQLRQFGRTIGEGFSPLLTEVNAGLGYLRGALEKLDQALPGAKNDVLVFGGAALALVAGIGGIGIVWPAFAAGFALFGSGVALIAGPIGLAALAVLALAGAGYKLCQDWQDILNFFGVNGPRAGLHPVGGRHNQFAPLAAGLQSVAVPALPAPDGPLAHTRAWYLQHKNEDHEGPVSEYSSLISSPARVKVDVSLGLDGDGRLIVKDAKSDSRDVSVSAPTVNPGQTLGRP